MRQMVILAPNSYPINRKILQLLKILPPKRQDFLFPRAEKISKSAENKIWLTIKPC
jgi:hypothetical protein